MKTAIKHCLLASSILFTTPLAAEEERLATIRFVSGDNGGALAVAESVYGKSPILETAIIDVNSDGNAEIAVKFKESCNQTCATTILNFDNSKWIEIFAFAVDELKISKNNGTSAELRTSFANFELGDEGYVAFPFAQTIEELSESTPVDGDFSLEAERRGIPNARIATSDVDGDGLHEYFIFSDAITACGAMNYCPVLVYSESGDLIHSGFSEEGVILISQNAFHLLHGRGFSTYSFDGQNAELTNKIDSFSNF